MAKNKNINITPSKGISIVIKNDFQPPPIKPKKKRKYKKKSNLDLLKMPTMPSYIPGSGDVSYIKPQYAATSLNRSMIFPGVPQSLPQLTPPPQLPQLTAPPTQPQLPAPQPFTFSLDNKFGSMLENILMPREYGFKTNSYAVPVDILDDEIMDALPKAQQDQYIEKKVAPQIEEQIKDIEFDNEEDSRVNLIVHNLKPPFLDGRVSFSLQQSMVSVVKDPTSDFATNARNGSNLLKDVREKRDQAKMRKRFWRGRCAPLPILLITSPPHSAPIAQ